MNTIIQGLWIGSKLSVMEQLSIASFLENGHEYHLYVYDKVENIPAGTVVKDGNEILPSSMIFQYQERKSYAGFACFFRYKLLLEKGGWWVDTDIICIKPFNFDEKYVFSTEFFNGAEVPNAAVIKSSAGSQVISYAWQVCQSKNPTALVWGEVGPRLLTEAIKKFSLERFAKPHQAFCPIGFHTWEKVFDPKVTWEFDETAYAIHLWNEMWRLAERDKNQRYSRNCLYEKLKNKYLSKV